MLIALQLLPASIQFHCHRHLSGMVALMTLFDFFASSGFGKHDKGSLKTAKFFATRSEPRTQPTSTLALKVARYVIIDDVIIAVRISTNDNDINNNYNIYYKEDKPKTYGW